MNLPTPTGEPDALTAARLLKLSRGRLVGRSKGRLLLLAEGPHGAAKVRFFVTAKGRARRRCRAARRRCGRGRARRLLSARRAALASALLVVAACGAAVVACGWNGWQRSVRFNLYDDDGDRLRLPPLPFAARGDAEADARREEQFAAEAPRHWQSAEDALARGDLEQTRAALRLYVERGAGWRVESAVDQLDALSALDRGSPAAHVRAYLDARRAYDRLADPEEESEDDAREESDGAAKSADALARALDAVPRDANLDDNVAYLRAAESYRAGDLEAPRAFADAAARHPRSEKHEAALYMAGRAWMARSKGVGEPGAPATDSEPCLESDCRDAAWVSARQYFSRVVVEHPRGRLSGEARGWLAYLHWRVGDRAEALAEYYRMLADEHDAGANHDAHISLRFARRRATDSDMQRVEALLADEPRAALTYAYHNVYNYASGSFLSVPPAAGNPYESCQGCDDERGRWATARADELRVQTWRAELQRVVRFATRMLRRHPKTPVGGAFTSRLAQASYELEDYEAARAHSTRALAQGLAGGERAAALWVKAASEYAARDFAEASATLRGLVAEFPSGHLTEGARRMLALVAEDSGDLDAALEQYLALGYAADAAYFVEVLMTPEQLETFIRRRPAHDRREQLLYALGLRQLRAGRYRDAQDTLRRVRTVADEPRGYSSDDYHDPYDDSTRDPKYNFHGLNYWYLDGDDYCYDTISCRRAEQFAGVYADWVLLDLQRAADLERLDAAVAAAADDEAKAEAMYQLASYLYAGSNLKFYNPLAWRGMRATLMSALDESKFRSPGEADALWRYAREHEPVARALALYLELARRYPTTRAAPDALYTAVLCHQQLSGYNAYWRYQYDAGLHAGERMVTLADVRRAYPRYRLPRDGDWQPSTRTVGGEPAWDKPARAVPPTRTQKARRAVARVERGVSLGWSLFGEVAGGRVRRWSLALLSAAGLWLLFRRTRPARRSLLDQLARRAPAEAAAPRVLPRPASSYAAHLPHAFGERARAPPSAARPRASGVPAQTSASAPRSPSTSSRTPSSRPSRGRSSGQSETD